MGSIDIPPFMRDKMKQKIQTDQNGQSDVPPFMQKIQSNAEELVKKKEPASEDIYSGKRPSSYPLDHGSQEQKSPFKPLLNSVESNKTTTENKVDPLTFVEHGLGLKKEDLAPHTIYNNASNYILNDLENHPEILKNAPYPDEFKKQVIKGDGDINIQRYAKQRVDEIEAKQNDLASKIFDLPDKSKAKEYISQIRDLQNQKDQLKANASEINDVQAVNNTPPPTDFKDATDYFRKVGMTVNKFKNPIEIANQEKNIKDGTNGARDPELVDLENFKNEQAGIAAKKKQLDIALGNGEITPEEYKVQSDYVKMAESTLLSNNPGAKAVIDRNYLSKIIEEKRNKKGILSAESDPNKVKLFSGTLFHDLIRYTPSDSEVKDAISEARKQGIAISPEEEQKLIADKAQIPGTSALGNLYQSTIGSTAEALNNYNPFLTPQEIEAQKYQHESRLQPTQSQTEGVLGYVNKTVNTVGTVLKWAALGKFFGTSADAIAGGTVGAETAGGIDEALGGIRQLTEAQRHLAGTALTSGLLVYPEAKDEAKKFTKDEAKQDAYAGTVTLLNTLAFTSLNPEGIVKGIVGKLGKTDFTENFLKTINKEGGINEIKPETFKNTLFNGLKKAAGANVSATTTMSLLNLANQATDVMFGKKQNIDMSELNKEAVNSFISFAPLSLLQGAVGSLTDRNRKNTTVQMINEAAKDPIAFRSYMDNAVKEGKISQQDANKKIQIVNTQATLRQSNILPKHLSEENKAKYLDNLRRELEIKETMKDLPDENLMAEKEQQIKDLQEERKNILNPPAPVEEPKSESPKTEVTPTKVEAVSGEDLKGKKIYTDFNSTIADKDNKLLPFGEEIKQRINAGEPITIVTKSEDREGEPAGTNKKRMLDALGLKEQPENLKIIEGATPEKKAELAKDGVLIDNSGSVKEASDKSGTEFVNANKYNTGEAKKTEESGLTDKEKELLKPYENSPLFMGMTTPEQKLKYIADQAQNINDKGEKDVSGINAEPTTRKTFGNDLVDAAINKYPAPKDEGKKAESNKVETTDYRGQHQLTEIKTTANDLIGNDAAPSDLWEHMNDYHDLSDKSTKESYRVLKSIQGKPDEEVTIYRSVPNGVDKINEGDWVTLSKNYAKEHGMHESDPSKDMPVISMKVKAKYIGWDGNDLNEFVYNPKNKSNEIERENNDKKPDINIGGDKQNPQPIKEQPIETSIPDKGQNENEQHREKLMDMLYNMKDSKFGERIDDVLSQKDREKGVTDLRNGKDSAAAKKVKSLVDGIIESGTIPIIRGRGGQTERFDVPMKDWFREPLDEKEIDAAEKLDDFTTSIINDEGINIKNIDNLKHLFNGFPYDEADFNKIKRYLSEQDKGNANAENIGKESAKSEPIKEEPKQKVGKYESKAREIADKINKAELPSWLINTDATISKSGIGADDLKRSLAEATILVGKALDKGIELADAIKEGANKLVDDYVKGLGAARLKPDFEKQLRDGFENYYKENAPVEEKKSETPPEPPKEGATTEGEGNKGDFTSVSKANLEKEVKGAKELFEKQDVIKWNDTYQKGLENLQKMYPDKSLYEAMRARLNHFVGKLERKEIFNPTSEDNAVFNVLMNETLNRLNKVKGIDSDNFEESVAAQSESDLLNDDLLNIAKVVNPEGEAGRAFNILRSMVKIDPNYGLKLKQSQLLKSKGNAPLTDEEKEFAKNNWEEERQNIEKQNEARVKSLQENFDKKIAELQKEYEAKLKSNKATLTDKTIREKTLSQSGKELADKIRRFKSPPGALQTDITFGLRNAAVEAVAQVVEQGAKLADAIKKVLQDERFKDLNEDDLTNHLIEIANRKTPEETLDAIKKYAKENELTDVTKEMVGKNLIKDYVDSHIGEVDQKDILDKAAKDLKEVLPDIDKQKLIEAYLKEGDYKPDTKRKLESSIKEQKDELKKIAQSELTADQEQKILLRKKKELANRKIKEFTKKLENGEFEEPQPKILNKEDAELIKLKKEQTKIEGKFRKKQDELRQKNKSNLELTAELGRSVYVAYLLHRFLTLGKVAAASIVRPIVEGSSRMTFGKIFDKFFPDISKAAKLGGESSSWQASKLGYEAWFKQRGQRAIEKKAIKVESDYLVANKKYEDYKNSASPNEERLKKLKTNRDIKLKATFGNLAYQFIGGSSIKDALQAFIHRSNEIERQFGKVSSEGIEGKNELKQDDTFPTIAKKLGKQVVEGGLDLFTGYKKDEKLAKQIGIKVINDADYILGFIGRSHSAVKTFSGRYSFASAFMARIEGAVDRNIDLTPDKVLEFAHESYLDWERGKYQNPNQLSDWWSHTVNQMDKNPEFKTIGKIGKQAFKTEVAIQRVPVNILWEEISQYAGGLAKVAGLFGGKASIPKVYKEIKSELKDEGLFTNTPEFKEALKERLSNLDPYQSALIYSCFRKGSLGMGVYATALILGGIHYGIFPHMGQKKKKDEADLAPNELNPGQLMVGNTKYSENVSALVSHTQFLWPTFMGLGMAQAYHDNIKKGETTKQAAADAAYLHLNIILGNIPQFAPVQMVKERSIDPIVRKSIKGAVGAKHQGFTKEDEASSVLKYYWDKGIEFTPFDPAKIEIPNKGKLSELPEEKWKEYNTQYKETLKEELDNLKGQTFYVTPDGNAHTKEPSEGDYQEKVLSQLTVAQLKKAIRPAEAKATAAAKEKISEEK